MRSLPEVTVSILFYILFLDSIVLQNLEFFPPQICRFRTTSSLKIFPNMGALLAMALASFRDLVYCAYVRYSERAQQGFHESPYIAMIREAKGLSVAGVSA
jgi:hypothetical protein